MTLSLPLASAPPVSTARHRRMARALLLPAACGLAMASSFAAGVLLLDRAFTGRTLAAAVHIGIAAAIAAALALLAVHLLRPRRWPARFAISIVLLSAGTCALASLTMGVGTAWTRHTLTDLALADAARVVLINVAAALYTFLTVAAPLILPAGVPLVVLFAALVARTPR
jgi:hypothetical protein